MSPVAFGMVAVACGTVVSCMSTCCGHHTCTFYPWSRLTVLKVILSEDPEGVFSEPFSASVRRWWCGSSLVPSWTFAPENLGVWIIRQLDVSVGVFSLRAVCASVWTLPVSASLEILTSRKKFTGIVWWTLLNLVKMMFPSGLEIMLGQIHVSKHMKKLRWHQPVV